MWQVENAARISREFHVQIVDTAICNPPHQHVAAHVRCASPRAYLRSCVTGAHVFRVCSMTPSSVGHDNDNMGWDSQHTKPAPEQLPRTRNGCAVAAAAVVLLAAANLLDCSDAFAPPTAYRGRARFPCHGRRVHSARDFWCSVGRVARPLPSKRTPSRHTSCTCSNVKPKRASTVATGTSTSPTAMARSAPSSPSVEQWAAQESEIGSDISNGRRRQSGHAGKKSEPPREVVLLSPGDPIEFWHAKGLVLGNYEGPVAGRKSLAVRTEKGDPCVIDAGQIVGVWSEKAMRGALPRDTAHWNTVRSEARAMLQHMPARGLDLGPFWRSASSMGKGFVATPAHAAEFLFGDGVHQRGLKKRRPFQFRRPGETLAPSAVERAAAVQVLAGELNRFKRVVSKRVDERPQFAGAVTVDGPDGHRLGASTAPAEGRVLIDVGGFKALDQSVAATREIADFCRVWKSISAKSDQNRATAKGGDAGGRRAGGGRGVLATEGLFEPAFLLILHSLEAFALGGDERSLIPEAKRVMELQGKCDPSIAKDILIDVGLWTTSALSDDRRGRTGSARLEDEVEPGDATGATGVIPWPREALEAATLLVKERARRRGNYKKRVPQGAVGEPAAFGRYDFRAATFGVYCIDGAGTSFLDDAFSIDPKTREIFIHITDVQGLVAPNSALDEVARLRAASEYLPKGPLFMMPPAALKAMSFSDRSVNEAVTVGIRINPETGAVASSRVMLTVLPPAIPITFEQADRLLDAGDSGEDLGEKMGPIAAEIRALEFVSRRSSEASGRAERGREGMRLRADRGGEIQALEVPQSRALALVDELLTIYTLEVHGLCRKAGVAMPSLVGQQDRVAAGRSRYGTGPLRRYVDILAQRQIVAILRGTGYLGKKFLLETASYLTWRQNKTRQRRQEEAGRLSLESLVAHCATQRKATGLAHAVVPARGTGKGREVRLEGLGVYVHAKRAPGSGGRGTSIARGQQVKVLIEKVDPQLKQVVATEFTPEG